MLYYSLRKQFVTPSESLDIAGSYLNKQSQLDNNFDFAEYALFPPPTFQDMLVELVGGDEGDEGDEDDEDEIDAGDEGE